MAEIIASFLGSSSEPLGRLRQSMTEDAVEGFGYRVMTTSTPNSLSIAIPDDHDPEQAASDISILLPGAVLTTPAGNLYENGRQVEPDSGPHFIIKSGWPDPRNQ